MGFFFWLLCIILVVALVLLLFPFSFRIEFEAGERGARAFFFFFKKKIYEYEKKWGKDADDNHVRRESRPTESGMTEPNGWDLSEAKVHKCVDRESRPSSLGHDRDQHLGQERSDCPKTREGKEGKSDEPRAVSESAVARREKDVCRPERNVVESKDPELSFSTEGRESIHSEPKAIEPAKSYKVETAKAPEPPKEKKSAESVDLIEAKGQRGGEAAVSSSKLLDTREPSDEEESPSKKSKKKKRKLTDREFWTIVLTPELDKRGFKYLLKILSSVFTLLRIKFENCYVEGIRSDYQTMGYIAAVNGFLKAFPYVGAWDFRMDWCHEKELCAKGTIFVGINLLRLFSFVLATLFYASILLLSFWFRRSRVLKTNELPELDFIRRKIVDLIVED